MTFTIKNELIGTWNLLSFIEVPINGMDSKFPMGKNPKGILIYSPNGNMSIEITNSNLPNNTTDKNIEPNNNELNSFLHDFLSYAGTYKINDSIATVKHIIGYSSLSDNVQEFHERKIDFEGDILYLKSLEPILSNNEYVNSYMTWQRVEREEMPVFSQKEIFDSTNSIKEKSEFMG